jgi:hypothetical protein
VAPRAQLVTRRTTSGEYNVSRPLCSARFGVPGGRASALPNELADAEEAMIAACEKCQQAITFKESRLLMTE